MNNPELIVMFFLIFGGGSMLTKMWSTFNNTRIEMARIRSEQRVTGTSNTREVEALRAELESTRKELQALRDTSMQYDISFDTALGRMESRVAHVERRIGVAVTDGEVETITLTGR